MVVCTSAEATTNCVAQMGAVNTAEPLKCLVGEWLSVRAQNMAEPLSDGYTVQAQSANDWLKNSVSLACQYHHKVFIN